MDVTQCYVNVDFQYFETYHGAKLVGDGERGGDGNFLVNIGKFP